MKKMMNPELEIVRFGAEDVIATSGVVSKYNISAGEYSIASYVPPDEHVPYTHVEYQAHVCNNEASHFHMLSQNLSEGHYYGMEFADDGIPVGPLSLSTSYYFPGEGVPEDGFYFKKDYKWVFCPDSGK